MCGFYGYIKSDRVTEPKSDVLKHRGPDEFGVHQDDFVLLAHNRLSIIDLNDGQQPLLSENRRYSIVYNGEIYNYKDLRSELQKSGYSFKTNSDTEVILAGHIHWKEKILDRLRGMFSFAIYDKEQREFFCARDPFGIKPFFYLFTDNDFIFSSELTPIKEAYKKLSVNSVSISNYFLLGYIPAPRTAFDNVFKLEPGHCLKVSFRNDVFIKKTKRYYSPGLISNSFSDENEVIKTTRDVLKSSIAAHLTSDVPVGALLSGGIDSSLIVKLMTELVGTGVPTFSIGFEHEESNELPYSELVSEKYATSHHTEIVKAEAIDLLPKLVQHYGEPFGDSSAIPSFYLTQLVSKDMKVVLSGDGGDEMFAGYGSYDYWYKQTELRKVKTVKQALYQLAHSLLPERFPFDGTINKSAEDWIRLWEIMKKEDVIELIPGTSPSVNPDYQKYFEQLPAPYNLMLMDIDHYLSGDILTKMDIAAMMNSVEVRTPFIDKAVFDHAFSIPANFYNSKKGIRSKFMLKEILREDFDYDFLNRKKQGFSIPINQWLLNDPLWVDKIGSLKNDTNNSIYDHLDINKVRSLDKPSELWLLLIFEEWLKQNV